MKLQRIFVADYKKKKYYKHVVVIPSKIVRELRWNTRDSLAARIEDRSNMKILVIERETPKARVFPSWSIPLAFDRTLVDRRRSKTPATPEG